MPAESGHDADRPNGNPAGDDQHLVRDHELPITVRGRVQNHAPIKVEITNLAHHHMKVLLPSENDTQGRWELVRGERTGRDLMERRLEQMKIAPIDENDLDRHAPETAGGLKAAEAAPYNDHPMSSLGFAH